MARIYEVWSHGLRVYVVSTSESDAREDAAKKFKSSGCFVAERLRIKSSMNIVLGAVSEPDLNGLKT